jgi:hypothetical protein
LVIPVELNSGCDKRSFCLESWLEETFPGQSAPVCDRGDRGTDVIAGVAAVPRTRQEDHGEWCNENGCGQRLAFVGVPE